MERVYLVEKQGFTALMKCPVLYLGGTEIHESLGEVLASNAYGLSL